jgi:nucleotide-binding universal stress UspA family protein
MVKDRATYQTGMRAASPRPVTCVTASRSVLKEPAPREEKTMKAATARTAVRFRNILFATDFSPPAAQAIPYVKKIAKHYDADLVALHVQQPLLNPTLPPRGWTSEVEAAKAQNHQHRAALLRAFEGIRTLVVIEEGDIQSRLNAAIERNNTDLVVIGTRGRTGLGKLLLGSVAEEIFRTVSCPVLTVGPRSDSCHGAGGQFREILYATDFSTQSQGAAAYAVSLAQEFQSRLILLHVIPEPKAGDLVSAADVTTSSEKLLRKLVPPEAEAWCKPEYFVERGDPAEKILEIAKLRETDLIVLGVRPEEGVPGAATHLAIATAHKVVSHATCPVLTVRH